MFWLYFIAFLGLAVYTYKKLPGPQQQKTPGLGDLTVPTSEEGRPIPILFGTVLIKSPQSSWYGDFEAVPIRKKGGKK